MPKPVCVKCQRFYRPKRNGVGIVEGMPVGQDVLPGTAQPEHWHPYKLWMADLWECQGCGHQLVAGFGREPIAERHHPQFEEKVEAWTRVTQMPQINDC